jgi:hypothetical protein
MLMSALQPKAALPPLDDLLSGLNGALNYNLSRYMLAIAAAALIASAATFALIELGIVKGNTRVMRLVSSSLLAVGLLAVGFALALGQ